MNQTELSKHITAWLNAYCEKAVLSGFIVGISGGVDSALTSLLCAHTGKRTILVNMPIRQAESEYERAKKQIEYLQSKFSNVESLEVDLTSLFQQFEKTLPKDTVENALAMANTRARLRMTTLYAIGQTHTCLVAGTGNKIEDFGVGFFTKYGDGGVDISPIADLTKTEVKNLASSLGVINEILIAKPTDGLWGDDRSDEDQLGATYPELEWAMEFKGNEENLDDRHKTVLSIFRKLNSVNKHKMEPIPVCLIPNNLR